MATNFKWIPGGPRPHIEDHTKTKLDVLKSYLDSYFDTVVPNPATDQLNITLVDGFSGGGAYQDGGEIRLGSPLVMLDAVARAAPRLNAGRNKPLAINARFYFIDSKAKHISALRAELSNCDYYGFRQNTTILQGAFISHLPKIITDIQASQRAGRSIFFLDQFGYSAVPMEAVRTIFQRLDRAEVVLNFAIDGLLNYLRDASSELPLYQQLGIDKRFIQDWNERKDEAMGRAITQRALMANIHAHSGAKFFTPFMLWSSTDKRWMMLAHLSQHQTARNKMLHVHWDKKNSFIHFGNGGSYNLGYDSRLKDNCDYLFNFSEQDHLNLQNELASLLPTQIFDLLNSGDVDVQKLLSVVGNRTAGLNDDIIKIISILQQERDLEIRSASGKMRRIGSKIEVSDQLMLPKQRKFYFSS